MNMVTDKFGRPLKDLRISVTDRCNFRCPFCMPAETFGGLAFMVSPLVDYLPNQFVTAAENIVRRLGEEEIHKAAEVEIPLETYLTPRVLPHHINC